MKYAAIAALIAVVSAADVVDCPKEAKVTTYTDDKCKTVDPDTEVVKATTEQKKLLEEAKC